MVYSIVLNTQCHLTVLTLAFSVMCLGLEQGKGNENRGPQEILCAQHTL